MYNIISIVLQDICHQYCRVISCIMSSNTINIVMQDISHQYYRVISCIIYNIINVVM